MTRQPTTRQPSLLTNLQRRWGSFNPNQWQNLRGQFYSMVKYPEAGQSELLFFGNTLATAGYNKQLTNIPKPNSFGTEHFLIKGIYLDLFIADFGRGQYASTDLTTLAADYLYGMIQAGVLEMKVGSRKVLEVPKPFLQMPPGNGASEMITSGLSGVGAGTGVVPPPAVDLLQKKGNRWLLEPEILIQSEETFELKVSFPTGVIPILAQTITDDTTNPLYVQIVLDGVRYRPVQ